MITKLGSVKAETRACPINLTTLDGTNPSLFKAWKKVVNGTTYVCDRNPGTYILADGSFGHPCPVAPFTINCNK